MLGRGHHSFLLEVEVEAEEGVPGVRVSGVLRVKGGGRREGGEREKSVYGGEDDGRGRRERR
jgi:hypothetical protein